MPIRRIHFLVHGRVQGVNFRSFTEKKANSYGLTGWVTNTSNNKVEGEAQGDEESIEKFLKDIGQGPPAAHVVKVDHEEQCYQEGEDGFDAS